jgi:hypothetical protein
MLPDTDADDRDAKIREWFGFAKEPTPGTPVQPLPTPPPGAGSNIACWICGRRSPRYPATDWLAVLHRCDGRHQLFHCCGKACHQMAGPLLVGIASLLQRH